MIIFALIKNPKRIYINQSKKTQPISISVIFHYLLLIEKNFKIKQI